ncbi:hypothetical protein FKW77_009735 [Venturia effusa]|uniref:Cyanovirin-N domain-containing protein n=1 Tax=Venturia effusa TaxID=50376 RepID=A0A517LEP2_9PEZI|nr:hypothetical protein FKW77_009735 [Venturia effusa]
MKSFNFLASVLALAAMVASLPIEMDDHRLCACQQNHKSQLLEDSTIGACAAMGGEMESFEREIVEGGNIDFAGRYCKPHNTKRLSGKKFNIACRNHNALDSTCPWG